MAGARIPTIKTFKDSRGRLVGKWCRSSNVGRVRCDACGKQRICGVITVPPAHSTFSPHSPESIEFHNKVYCQSCAWDRARRMGAVESFDQYHPEAGGYRPITN